MPPGVPPIQRSPGGDFGWLKKDYTWTAHGETETEDGSTHGHSIVALDKGYDADPVNTQAPGGTFSGSQLGCQSCHDPHGKGKRLNDGSYSTTGAPVYTTGSTGIVPSVGLAVGTFNLLAYPGYLGASGVTWGGWPVAVRPSSYNRTEATTQTRVAYGRSASGNTWGDWCGSCHAAIANETGLEGHPSHPIDETLPQGIVDNYNNYVKSGQMDGIFGGTTPGPYTSLVPFAEGAGSTITVLASHAVTNNSYLNGPSTSDEVTCFSCHRAHASGWKHALRWNSEATFLVSGGAYVASDMGRTVAETQAAYYDRPATYFGAYQRSLCNKCHAKD
jgi:hypothetical protein